MLSQNAQDKILGWKEKNIVKTSLISWHKLFYDIAEKMAERSKDGQTHCGAVIVRDNRILATGYNSFIGGIDDSELPNWGDEKYPFMVNHAEINAIINCAREGISTKGAAIYTTAKCCNSCLQQIWQANITAIYEGKYIPRMCKADDFKINREILLHLMGDQMKIAQYNDLIS